jgi:hypothetical protein
LIYFTVITILFPLLTNREGGGGAHPRNLFCFLWKFAVYSFRLPLKLNTELARTAEQSILPQTMGLLFSALEILGSYLNQENGPHIFLTTLLRPTRQIPKDYMLGTPHPTVGRYTTQHNTTHSPVVVWACLDSKRANDKEPPKYTVEIAQL